MTLVATYPTKLGELLKAEFMSAHGYERDSRTVNVTATMEIGAVVKTDGDGTYSIVAAADVAALPADIAIVIDDRIYDGTTGDRAVACLAGGPGASGGAVVVREQLKFGDALTSGQVDTVVAAIEALGIKVGTQV